jgi:hypothetical protein
MNRNTISIIFINLIICFLFGIYYEAYEGVLSSFVSGIYTKPCINDWNNDVQFLLLSLYARINQFVPNIQLYGIVLFILTFIVISFFGIMIFKVLILISPKKNLCLFLLLYIPFSIDNLLNLSSTRIAFYAILSIIMLFEYYRYLNIKKYVIVVVISMLFFIISCLMRFEIVILVSLFYLIVLYVFKRFYIRAIFPFIISLSIFLIYTILISQFATQAKKTAFYKEKQFIDRNDIDYSNLSKNDLLEVEAFRNYHIIDDVHFKLDFYNRISKSNSKIKLTNLLDGVGFSSFFNIMGSTIWNMKKFGITF